MKTLTLKQPWATLIAKGLKEYEFRSWKTSYRGPLLIHAGMGMDKEALKRFEPLGFEYEKSEIVCLVELVDCIEIDDAFRKRLLQENPLVYQGIIDRENGQYAWKIKLIQVLSIPNVKGKLSIWEYPKELDEIL